MSWMLLAIAALVGALLPIQAAANARLAATAGSAWWGALVNFAVGLICLMAITAALRTPIPSSGKLAGLPPWAWIGGIIGACFVAGATYLVPRVGAVGFLGCAIAGQMVASVLVDHFGLMGMTPRPLTLERIGGIMLLGAGVVLVRLG